MDAMSDLWEHSDAVLCTHPGWTTLRGWSEVAASFFALFNNGTTLQFLLTEPRVDQRGDTAWVVIDENILGDQTGATVSAMNLFVRKDNEWKLVCHHASLVSPPTEDLAPEDL